MEWNTSTLMSQNQSFSGSSWVVVRATYYSLASLVAVVGNCIIMITVYKRHPLHTVSYVLVANLALKDFLFAIVTVSLPIPSLISRRWIFPFPSCTIYAFLTCWLAYAELLLLGGMSLDRYLACIYPLRYHQLVTNLRFKVALFVCWSYSFVWALMPLVGFSRYTYSANIYMCELDWYPTTLAIAHVMVLGTLLFCPGTALIVFCYIQIYKVTKKMSQVTAIFIPPRYITNGHSASDVPTSENPQLSDNGLANGASYGISQDLGAQGRGNLSGNDWQGRTPVTARKPPIRSEPKGRRNKATLTVALVTGIYFFCWLPYVSVRMARLFRADFLHNPTVQTLHTLTIYSFSVATFINPCIYAVYNTEFRNQFKRLLC